MKNKTIIIASAIVALGIAVLGFAVKAGIESVNNDSRIVTVRGLSTRDVQANKVTWPIVTKEAGNNLGDIYNRLETTNATILEYLHEHGIEDADIQINAPVIYDNATERYRSDNVSYRYTATNVVVVTSAQVDTVSNLIRRQAQLLRKGVAILAGDYSYPVVYEYTGLNDIKPEMVEEATANARMAAEKFADDSHSKLGKIKTASQGQFSIEDRDQYTPNIKTVRVVTNITYQLKD